MGETGKILSVVSQSLIRFSEVDSMGVVWHGNYVKLLEDGREAFGNTYGLGYLDVYKNGLFTPIVKLNLDYKNPLFYGDVAIIETKYIDNQAAKICFEYTITKKSDNQLIIKAQSTQVFLDKNRQLILTVPPFFEEWKKQHGLAANKT